MNDTDTGFLNFVAALTTALPALCKRSTDTGFLNFVAALTTALPALCKRSEDDPQSPRLRVIYNPDKKRAEAGEILIGLGYVLDATGQDIEQPGVVLQHKGSSDHSISALLQHADDDRIADWRASANPPPRLRSRRRYTSKTPHRTPVWV